jgi:hypothetical protein
MGLNSSNRPDAEGGATLALLHRMVKGCAVHDLAHEPVTLRVPNLDTIQQLLQLDVILDPDLQNGLNDKSLSFIFGPQADASVLLDLDLLADGFTQFTLHSRGADPVAQGVRSIILDRADFGLGFQVKVSSSQSHWTLDISPPNGGAVLMSTYSSSSVQGSQNCRGL